ncbi:MAG: trimethylamine methyltransferase family protein [Methanobacteriota archaeon]|nr:MAG: trimethylamine methyltransferase family protein [Euryarchaeota archaeon]
MQVEEPVGRHIEILSRSDLDDIHGATMEVLRRLGVKVLEPNALELFDEAGADVDRKTKVVRIPEGLVKETVRKAPSEFKMYGRDPKYQLDYSGNKVHFGVAGCAIRVKDLDGRIRPGTVADVESIARVADYLENIHHILLTVTPFDVPDEVYHLHCINADWKNSVKTTDGFTWTARKAQETVDMAAILRGSYDEVVRRPPLLGFMNPVSPMQLSSELTEGALVYAKYRQPMVVAPEALAGATAPSTLAGLLTQQNAEVLAGIMVTQLASSGTPVLYGTASTVMDMRTGTAAMGGPEVGLVNIATGQLGRYYSLPRRGTGGVTDSKLVDAQAGAETALSMLMAALSGMNFIYEACGGLDGTLTFSYEKLVVDDEIAGMVSRTLRGIEVNEETLAVDEICKYGSSSYLGSPHTGRTFRTEHYMPTLFDRRHWEAWLKAGGRDISLEARRKAKWILKEHHAEPVDGAIQAEIDEFIRKTTRGWADSASTAS